MDNLTDMEDAAKLFGGLAIIAAFVCAVVALLLDLFGVLV